MLNLAQNDHSLCDLLLSVGSSWWNETHLYILFVFNEDHYICRFGRLWTVNRDTWTEMDYTRPWLSQLLHNKAKTSMKNFLNHSQDRVIYSFAHIWENSTMSAEWNNLLVKSSDIYSPVICKRHISVTSTKIAWVISALLLTTNAVKNYTASVRKQFVFARHDWEMKVKLASNNCIDN